MTSLPSLPLDSSPSPSLPFRPFSHLPAELVRHIIGSMTPLGLSSSIYSKRQATLQNLCLVSRQFRHLAQPLLFATAKLQDQDQLILLMDPEGAGVKAASWNRQLVFDSFPEPGEVEWVMSGFSALRTLVLIDLDFRLNLEHLAIEATELSVLRLASVTFTAPDAAIFPSLTELSLLGSTSRVHSSSTLSPSMFPSLRAFFFGCSYSSWHDFENILISFVDQLDVISLDSLVKTYISEDTFNLISPKTLFDFEDTFLQSFYSIQSLRLMMEDGYELTQLATVTELIQTCTGSLPSLLYLPPQWSAAAHTEDQEEERLVCRSFEAACAKYKVELVYEEPPASWSIDSGISRDFWRRMKAQRED